MANKREVEQYLLKLKVAVCNRLFIDRDDPENKKTLEALEYTDDDVEDEIKSLETKNYSAGPLTDDKGYAKDFWLFGKFIAGREIYIKLKVKDINQDGERELNLYCISFHFSKHPMNYPYC